MIIGTVNTLVSSTPQRTLNAKNEIRAMLKTINNVKVFESQREEDEYLEILPGSTFVPYVVISFSGTSQTPRRQKAMTGARDSGEKISIVVRIVASSSDITSQVLATVHGKLLGFQPTGCSEVIPALYYSTGLTSNLGTPARHTEVQSYELTIS